jgi:hypothetical protein
MSQIISGIGQSKTITNLDTYNHTAGLASLYTVSVQLTEIPPSGVSIVIQQNSSTKATSVAAAAGQNHIELSVLLQCAVSDVISVILSSASAIDEAPNYQGIRGTLIITPGLVP